MTGVAGLAPMDEGITFDQLARDPYPIYRRLRTEAPVMRVPAVGRTLLTKYDDTRRVKDDPDTFSSDDPHTPMRRAFQAHTLMRKDGAKHRRERMAMAAAFSIKAVRDVWAPIYQRIAEEYVGRLPRGEVVDLFPTLAGPYAARGLAQLLGIEIAGDDDMQRWSQTLIDGAGNFADLPGPWEQVDRANAEMNACMEEMIPHHRAAPNPSALSVMVNADDPIPMSQIVANIKIAIGGGLNEPRDALLTVVAGLLSDPEQMTELKRTEDWSAAFEEGVRWCAPIQASSRLVTRDVEIRGCLVPKGDTVMTIQASANHDEEVYDHPERFDMTRERNPHQSFGNGPHFCQGMPVARRAVGDIVLPVLLERFPNISLPDSSAVRWHGFGFRGPITLPVRLD